ncbi:Asp-tRNA(Asn)/Glu-tRNA(Gln) amidotransferase subunit GatC [Phormidium yuhuli AB48]|uniref:Aspartyl/glutamyl-tRNA(Asn/Gln) amidotransferase subunit C n=1 Tax=Phormidium yuhuli AB48 TaxID=2940671 RepID=A0ABY5AMI8_9CYAN|nr:Asp-tRNA(Asn)/Glu-tRNA(Gln) amidotransferase subunit GatC [Phormidium yuhuli]USR89454.1 Asp-tRNA(Asn)/Glu-tRNA(Gln) amidotransferase subunit GatC [Phormidium yuhuli AB48]
MSQFNQDDVKKVAHLARLKLTENEETQFVGQLNGILDYFQQLEELDTENVKPTAHAIDMRNITRNDQQEVYPHREDLLESAPDREDEFFKVPKIL